MITAAVLLIPLDLALTFWAVRRWGVGVEFNPVWRRVTAQFLSSTLRRLFAVASLSLLSGCAASEDAASTSPNIPLDLWPRVLAHAAAEEMRAPQQGCETGQRDQAWLALAGRLRFYDHALRGGPPSRMGRRPTLKSRRCFKR